MVGKQASFVPAHAEMIDQDGTCSGWFRGRVEGALKGSKDTGDVFVEVTYLARRFSDELGLIGWEVS